MATFKDVMAALEDVPSTDRFDVGPAIFARRPWSPSSESLILFEDVLSSADHPGYDLVVEVAIAREVLEVWTAWRAGRIPSLEERAEAVLWYATHDAYQPVVDDPR